MAQDKYYKNQPLSKTIVNDMLYRTLDINDIHPKSRDCGGMGFEQKGFFLSTQILKGLKVLSAGPCHKKGDGAAVTT